jgi:HSP20 family protein
VKEEDVMAEKTTDVARQEGKAEKALAHKEPAWPTSPFHMFDRFAEEMDRVFDDFGFGRRWMRPHFSYNWLRPGREEEWMPKLDMFQRNNELVVRTDLPGLTKDDVKVEVTEDKITIQGERKKEFKEEKEGVYRTERSYGSFYREVALPEGAMTDQAKATFKDGVLEIAMPAPPDSVKKARRLDIAEPAVAKK